MPGRVHLINPSNLSFGVAVITPRWLYVLAAATGTKWGDPHLVDETLEHFSEAQFIELGLCIAQFTGMGQLFAMLGLPSM